MALKLIRELEREKKEAWGKCISFVRKEKLALHLQHSATGSAYVTSHRKAAITPGSLQVETKMLLDPEERSASPSIQGTLFPVQALAPILTSVCPMLTAHTPFPELKGCLSRCILSNLGSPSLLLILSFCGFYHK